MIDVNKAGLELIGYTKEEISTKNLADLLNEYQLPQAISLIDEVVTDGSPGHPVEFKIKTKDSGWLDVDVFPAPVFKDGKPVSIMGVCRDVTDRKNYEEAIQESEKNFRAIAENAGAGILVIVGSEGRFAYVNRMFASLTGYNLNEVRHKTISDIASPKYAETLLGRHRTILKGGVFRKMIEAEIQKKDGSIIPVEIIGARTFWKGEQADLVLVHEFKNRKMEADPALKRNEEIFRLALEAGRLRYWEWNSDTNEIYTPPESPNPSDWGFRGNITDLLNSIHPDDRVSVDNVMDDIKKGNDNFSLKIRLSKDPGRTIWGQINGIVFRDKKGDPVRVIGVGRDITGQVETENEKNELLKEKSAILDAMVEGVIACDFDGRIIETNPAYLKMTGLSREELIGKDAREMVLKTVDQEDAVRMLDAYPDTIAGKIQPGFDVTIVSSDGKRTPVHFVISYLRDNSGTPRGLLSVIRDISFLRKTQELLKLSRDELEFQLNTATGELIGIEEELGRKQEELKKNEEKFRSLVESMNEIFYMLDLDGLVTYVSPSVEKVFGYSRDEIIGRHFVDFLPTEDRDDVSGMFEASINGTYHDGEHRVYDKSGNLRWLNASVKETVQDGIITGLQGIISDITHRKLLQQRLVLSERLAATGQLAASIAHEINSPLQAITITLSSLKKACGGNEELSDGIDLLKGAFGSISDTVKNLLDLNRPGMEDKRYLDINDLIIKTVSLVKAHLKQNRIKISLGLGENLPKVHISPQHVGQVLLNLINNAVDAITGNKRSDRDYNIDVDGGEIFIKSSSQKGMIVVSVRDTGPGIFQVDMERIFTPFYSTKKGTGMGIGLSICRAIIEEHGGSLAAANSDEGGAVFIICLPLKRNAKQ